MRLSCNSHEIQYFPTKCEHNYHGPVVIARATVRVHAIIRVESRRVIVGKTLKVLHPMERVSLHDNQYLNHMLLTVHYYYLQMHIICM